MDEVEDWRLATWRLTMEAVWPASRRVGEKVALEGLLVALLVGNGWPELAVEMGVKPRRVN